MSIRVLQANIDNFHKGGAYKLIDDLGNRLVKDGIVFDYITMDHFNENIDISPSKSFSANLRANRITGHIKLPFYIYEVLKKHKYHIIHINTDSAWKAYLYAMPAKKAGVENIIIHIHATGTDGKAKWLKNLLHSVFKNGLKKISTKRIACSQDAADWFFGKENDCEIIHNGIVIEKYKFDDKSRKSIREELGITDEILFGNVGVISETKNQLFLLDVFAKVVSSGVKAKLILIGKCTDEWKNTIMIKADRLGVSDSVIVYGLSNNIHKMNSAIDIMIIPSKFEGFSLSTLEAQASGAYCFVSDRIPTAAIATDNVMRLPLEIGSDAWSDAVLAYLRNSQIVNRESIAIDEIYDIDQIAQRYKGMYVEMFNMLTKK